MAPNTACRIDPDSIRAELQCGKFTYGTDTMISYGNANTTMHKPKNTKTNKQRNKEEIQREREKTEMYRIRNPLELRLILFEIICVLGIIT